MIKKIFNNDSGATLIELLVTLSIISLIIVSVVANYRDEQKVNKLNLETNKFASYIRLAQNNTLGTVKYDSSVVGWGIYIDTLNDPSSYKLFADLDKNLRWNSGEANPDHEGKTIELDKEIEITDIEIGPMNSVDRIGIVFLPPNAHATLAPDSMSTSSEVIITLENQIGNSRRLEVNSFGLIEILK